MDHIFEIILIFLLIAIQSVFGVGLLLFGTPSFLLFGYDFANTINILIQVFTRFQEEAIAESMDILVQLSKKI